MCYTLTGQVSIGWLMAELLPDMLLASEQSTCSREIVSLHDAKEREDAAGWARVERVGQVG